MAQLSLQLGLTNDDETFASFLPGDNGLLLAALRDLLAAGQSGYIYLWSAHSSGRSHLLNAACTELSRHNVATGYLPLRQHAMLSPAMLDGMEHLSLLCLDDVDCVSGSATWQMAIFNLFNRLRALPQSRLLISGNSPPRQLAIALPDLVSRLEWGQIYKVQPLADEQKLQALQLRAHLRGFDLPDDVGNFLLKRQDRDMRTLCQTLDTLDNASISAQRKLTIPFVKTILQI